MVIKLSIQCVFFEDGRRMSFALDHNLSQRANSKEALCQSILDTLGKSFIILQPRTPDFSKNFINLNLKTLNLPQLKGSNTFA